MGVLLLHYMNNFLLIGAGKDKTRPETWLLVKCLANTRALVSVKRSNYELLAGQVYGPGVGRCLQSARSVGHVIGDVVEGSSGYNVKEGIEEVPRQVEMVCMAGVGCGRADARNMGACFGLWSLVLTT